MLSRATDVLKDLMSMSRRLGEPERDYVILGEGNTSARADQHTFWVKASGVALHGIEPEGFVQVRFAPVLELLDAGDVSDDDVKQTLGEAIVGDTEHRPSMEAFMHALVLQCEGVQFVGHTHPTAVTAILCSENGQQVIGGRLFPDEIVCCGIAPVWVPYADPGVPLARRVREQLDAYLTQYRERPRSILLQNHGLIALGATPAEVESTTAMWVKTARVSAGTFHFGGPRHLSDEQAQRIHVRPDEARRKVLIDRRKGR